MGYSNKMAGKQAICRNMIEIVLLRLKNQATGSMKVVAVVAPCTKHHVMTKIH